MFDPNEVVLTSESDLILVNVTALKCTLIFATHKWPVEIRRYFAEILFKRGSLKFILVFIPEEKNI